MILVDTSVWVDYLRKGNSKFSLLLEQGQVCIHPMIIGELACGNLKHRSQLLALLNNLPTVIAASHEEALYFLEQQKLMGKGIGYIDLHLLASCLLATNTQLWTNDKRLSQLADELRIGLKAH
jgi:predicted nucleic acid-binding protein